MTEIAPSELGPSTERRLDAASLAYCLLANYLLRAAGNCAGIALTLYLASLHSMGIVVKAEIIGIASLLYYLMELVGSPLFGIISDVRGRKPVMLLGPVLGGASIGLVALVPTIPLAIGSRLLAGLSTASSIPSALSYLSAETAHSDRARARVMGIYELASIVGIASGLVAAGFLWEALHLGTLLVVIGAFALSLALFALVRDPHPVSPTARSLSAQLDCLRSWPVLRLAPAWVAGNAIVGLWLSHLSFQLAKPDDPTQLLVGGFPGRQTGLIMGSIVVLFVIGIGLWTLVLGRLRTTRVMGIAIGGALALVPALALLNHSQPQETGRVLAFAGLSAALLLVVAGFTPAVLTYLANLAEETPALRGSVMGLYTVLLGVGQALGAVLGGYFADWRGVDGMIVYSAFLAVIAAAFVAYLARGDARVATKP